MKQITVKYGATSTQLNGDWRTIRELLDEHGTLLGIPDGVTVRLNGSDVTPSHELPAGSNVEFVKATGSKG